MRCDQHMGLNGAAQKIIQDRPVAYVEKTIRVYPDGRQETIPDKEVLVEPQIYDSYSGMFMQEYDLFEYPLKDGRVVREFVQAEPWSSGPVFFLALKDKKTDEPINETLWPQEEIDHC